jgi:hypothetical protein
MRKSIVFALIICSIYGGLYAAETKVEGKICSSWMIDLTQGKSTPTKFDLSRSYITVASKLSDYVNVNITLDMRAVRLADTLERTQGLSFVGYTMILKYAYAEIRPKFANNHFMILLGLLRNKHVEYIDNLWGRRYIERTILRLNDWQASSDLGITLHFPIGNEGKMGGAGLSVYNGAKYTDIDEKNKQKNINMYGTIKPLVSQKDFEKTQLVAQYYRGTRNIIFDSTRFASNYSHEVISAGAKFAMTNIFEASFDLNWNTLGYGADTGKITITGMSYFATFYPACLFDSTSFLKNLDLFGRIDFVDPNDKEDNDGKGMLFAGVEWFVSKGFVMALNYRMTDYENCKEITEKYIYINTEFRF